MLTLFRHNRFSSSLLLFVYALILRLPAFLGTPQEPIGDHSLLITHGILNFPSSDFIGQIIMAFMIFIQAAMINRLVIRNRMTIDLTLFPGLFYILLMSFTPANYCTHILILVNFVAIYSLSEIYKTFKTQDSNGRVYNSGVLTSFAALLYPPYIYFFVFNYVAISSLKSFKIRERIQLLLGFLSPLFLAGVWFLWYRRIAEYPNLLFRDHFDLWSFQFINQDYDYKVLGVFVVLSVWFVLNYRLYTIKKNMQAIKKIHILYWFLFFAGVAALFQHQLKVTHLILLTIPLSIGLAMNFAKMKQVVLAEILHLVFFAESLYFNAKILSVI